MLYYQNQGTSQKRALESPDQSNHFPKLWKKGNKTSIVIAVASCFKIKVMK